jgi:damage-control phosphatase, subfamily I
LKSTLECLECAVAQALRTARVATDDSEIHRRIVDETARRIPGLDLDNSPAVNSLCAYEITAELSGNVDPYKQARHDQNEQALALEPDLRKLLDDSDDRLEMALHLAAAGNIIDLGTSQAQHIDVHSAIEQVLREKFAIDHTDALRKSLATCKDLLFLLDNAGEIVFDKLLIEELLKITPVTAVVKGAPIINDVVMADAEQVGLTDVCEVIDNGGAFVGSPLNLIPQRFRDRMDRADVIVGKGQGNYETIDDYPGDVFLILRAKCDIVARHMGIQFGQVGLISTRVRTEKQG